MSPVTLRRSRITAGPEQPVQAQKAPAQVPVQEGVAARGATFLRIEVSDGGLFMRSYLPREVSETGLGLRRDFEEGCYKASS
jgi:hypothetical protein